MQKGVKKINALNAWSKMSSIGVHSSTLPKRPSFSRDLFDRTSSMKEEDENYFKTVGTGKSANKRKQSILSSTESASPTKVQQSSESGPKEANSTKSKKLRKKKGSTGSNKDLDSMIKKTYEVDLRPRSLGFILDEELDDERVFQTLSREQ